jgi:endonuclease/exonuclease/phosphatase family metal-dependent hydrolase
VFVQFSASTTATGSAIYRIGTTAAAEVNLEDCSGCGLNGWQWQDNGWGTGVLGPEIYFATTGTHRIRVQTREDGIFIDRIVLSPTQYLTTAPPRIGGTPTEPAPAPAPAPAPQPAPTGSTIRVLQWNIAQGWGQDSKSNIDRVVDWVIKMKPDVISFNEIMLYASSNQCQIIIDKLKARTGQTWYYNWAQKWGASSGEGSAIMSRFPLESVDDHLLSYQRAVAQARILVNGRHINLFATHLDHLYSSRRLTQVKEVKSWASGFAEQRIVIGDFNGWPGSTEIYEMARDYYDAWAEAVKANTEITYPDNPNGNTRRSRIDYVWYSRGASALVLKSAQVYDTRDASGLKPSDHNPLVATFEVR